MDLVFDIETVGYELESLSETQQEFLLRYINDSERDKSKEEQIDEAKRYLSLYPFTAKIVALGMLNSDTKKTMVLYEGEEEEKWSSEDNLSIYKSMSEVKMLECFWKYVKKCKRVVTFNGRGFDIPFIMMRSAINKIKPSINIIKNRFDTSFHIDILEQFTFYGIVKKFNLDFYCHSFGIESPKSKGITGMEVKELYKAGRIKDIAVYCGKDVKATFQLYNIWQNYLNI